MAGRRNRSEDSEVELKVLVIDWLWVGEMKGSYSSFLLRWCDSRKVKAEAGNPELNLKHDCLKN